MSEQKRIFIENVMCKECKGSGIYVGMAEKDGAGVVCHRCNGSGQVVIDITYTVFEEKKKLSKLKRIFEYNPGIGIGVGNGFVLEDFGGMPYKDWFAGKSFPKHSEMREFSCPAWWYQCVDYDLKPNWDECVGCGTFSSCQHFENKQNCWERFDKEQEV